MSLMLGLTACEGDGDKVESIGGKSYFIQPYDTSAQELIRRTCPNGVESIEAGRSLSKYSNVYVTCK